MNVDFTQRLCDCSLGEIAEAFLQGDEMSNGIGFVSDNQLRKLYAIVNNAINAREIGLIVEAE